MDGKAETNFHKDHRKRMKQRFLSAGLDSFAEHEVLELLLFYAIPQRNVNNIAHDLIEYFGSIEAVLEAPIDDLKSRKGIAEHTAILMTLVPQICRRYMVSKQQSFTDVLDTSQKAGNYLIPYYYTAKEEVVYLISLDAVRKVLGVNEVARGIVNTAEISKRKIIEIALSRNATGVIMSHNHTSGLAIPSAEDEITTKSVKAALDAVGIELWDHIVVAGNDFVSMADSKLL